MIYNIWRNKSNPRKYKIYDKKTRKQNNKSPRFEQAYD